MRPPPNLGHVNEEYEPTDNDEQVLEVLREGRANPAYIHDQTGLRKQRINDSLQRLTSAGWVRKPARGLYELVDDPRTE